MVTTAIVRQFKYKLELFGSCTQAENATTQSIIDWER